MTVAQTILDQIKTIDPRALWAWGTKELTNMGDGLRFKTSGMTNWKGYVYIKYNDGTDLYDIEFYRIRAHQIKNDAEYRDVFAEDLVRIIDREVG